MNLLNKIKNLFKPIQENSDGYHTFDELYKHRYALYIRLCKYEPSCWKSKLHSDNTMFDGEFIMGFTNEYNEQITYHLPLKLWDRCDFATTLDSAPEWDGHTSDMVIARLYGAYY